MVKVQKADEHHKFRENEVRQVHNLRINTIDEMLLSPNCEKLVTITESSETFLWDLAFENRVRRILNKSLPPPGGTLRPTSIAFSSDNKSLAIAYPEEQVRLWDVQGREPSLLYTLNCEFGLFTEHSPR